MAPIKLPCLMGGDCTFQTVQLEYEQAKVQQDGHMQYAHTLATNSAGEGAKKPEKFPRPEVRMDSSAEDWAEFEVTWGQYKEEYSLAGPALIRQLYACCADELKQGLSRSTGGGQFSLTESNLLKLMRQLAVRYQNPAVHVQEFLSMSQQQDEPVRQYLTRLKGTAARCNFMEKCVTCHKDVSYADSVIRFKLISGLNDQEIKEDILTEYPFQMIVADYFDVKGKSWLVIADRFSGWLSLHYYPREATSSDLIKSLKEYFCIFGVPENFSSDDGSQFRSTAFRDFLKAWGTEHRVSSAYHAHSNLRAETAVKSGKRLLLDNTRSDGSPDMDKVRKGESTRWNRAHVGLTYHKTSSRLILFVYRRFIKLSLTWGGLRIRTMGGRMVQGSGTQGD